MNLEYGPEYEDFRAEVMDFCKEYQGISFENTSNKNREGLVISYKTLDAKVNKRKLFIYKKKVKENLKKLNLLN